MSFGQDHLQAALIFVNPHRPWVTPPARQIVVPLATSGYATASANYSVRKLDNARWVRFLITARTIAKPGAFVRALAGHVTGT